MKQPTSKIIIGDSRSMKELHDSSVDLMVTSPPYWHIKDYGPSSQTGHGQTLHDYLRDMYMVWKETYRVLKPGRRACINIGDQFARAKDFGRYRVIPLHAEIILQMDRIGFDHMGSIIWNKSTTINSSGGAAIMGSYPYPPNGIVEIDYEHILLFRKPGKVQSLDRELKESSVLGKEEWKDLHISHWNFGGARQIEHEAMFPKELPGRLIRMFSLKGELILDPFMGSGTTALAAEELGRLSVGYELNGNFIPVIRKKFKEIPEDRLEIIEREGSFNPSEIDYIPTLKDISPPARKHEMDEVHHRVLEITGDIALVLQDAGRVELAGLVVKDIEGARQYLERFVRGKKVYLRRDEITGDHYVYLKNRIFINKELLRGGYADVDRSRSFTLKDAFESYLPK
ncbi:MAG: DNA methyltransferase [Thermoplasmatota archaeon]